MNHKLFINIAIRIVILFSVSMIGSVITPHLQPYFGDSPCGNSWGCGSIDRDLDWGIRHYLWNAMLISLFLLSVINLIIYIGKRIDLP